MEKQYKTPAMAAIHETMEGLSQANIIDKKTMRKFDETCLTPVLPITANKIRSIREKQHASQSVFAYYLNVSKSLISQWERGKKHPSGAALKLLTLVEKNGLNAIA